jgi:hypothetical protein
MRNGQRLALAAPWLALLIAAPASRGEGDDRQAVRATRDPRGQVRFSRLNYIIMGRGGEP